MSSYPARDKCFAHRFVRVLHKSCAAQDIGRDACYLLCIIAHTEDAARYAGPARFWNSQLMETLGFSSPKQLDAARDRAIEAGWLQYNRAGNRAVGEYFVTMPERFQGLTDAPVEEPSEFPILSSGGTNSGTNQTDSVGVIFPFSTQLGDGKRNEKVTESGKPSYPIPSPVPNTCPEQAPDPPRAAPAKAKKAKPAPSFLPDDMAVAQGMWADIDAMQPGRKPPNLDQWANDIRLMRERDHRSYVEIRGLWRLVQADSFWRTNVLSPAKLREKWDDLQLKLKLSRNGTKASSPARVHTPGRYDNDNRY